MSTNISISPDVAQWISFGFGVAGIVAALTPAAFPSYIPAGTVRDIIQTAGLVAAIGGGVQGLLHRYSSSDPGPGAPPDPPEVQKAMLEAKVREAVAAAHEAGVDPPIPLPPRGASR